MGKANGPAIGTGIGAASAWATTHSSNQRLPSHLNFLALILATLNARCDVQTKQPACESNVIRRQYDPESENYSHRGEVLSAKRRLKPARVERG